MRMMRSIAQASNFLPELNGFVVGVIDGDEQLFLRQAVFLGDQVPRVLNGVFFEIIAEGEVAQHFEECVVARRVPDVFQIVVLAPGPDTLLRGHGTVVRALLLPEEDVLELDHASVCEHQCWVIAGDQR